MAEGDLVARWARELAPLVGEPILDIAMPRRWADRPRALVGQRVRAVESRGKNLVIHLSNGQAIRTHAMMYGSWQMGEPGMELRKPPGFVRLRLLTPTHEAVFYNGPVVELLTPEELPVHPVLSTLGPDVMAADFDREEAARRVAAQGARAIGEVVLDQRVVAGIGNVFKSEALFLAGIHPERPANSLDRKELDALWDQVIPLMWRSSQQPGRIATTPPEIQARRIFNWAYRRRPHPCLRCGTPIEMIRQGEMRRTSYYCPHCQPMAAPVERVA